MPHWTFPGREGEVTPVYCYTSYPSAELFVNGRAWENKVKAIRPI
ncbi:Beta-galactosidase [Arcticibacter svalbardensis MN12-7]|uniref:Beta-galactosidase n=1 Tax=Arcticibacter svalbardensis MN12-7 TaxID=1150600 RepID=R9GP86_9SPHI|nr:Beta-galactosidase [Arcticibacter svalbardensis MN12-7]